MDENVFELFCAMQCEYCNGEYADTDRKPVYQEAGPVRIGARWLRQWAWYHPVHGGHRTMCRANQARSKWSVALTVAKAQAHTIPTEG